MLTGMRVLGFTHYVQGPAASQYLADIGADVVKVEPLDGGWERKRAVGGEFGGASATYLVCNRNKRSLAINLKAAGAKEAILDLVSTFDVIIENYRHGVLDRLGIGFEDLRKANPNIIFASATGWGNAGPMRDRPGQDLLVQARSGLIGGTGAFGKPTATGTALVDQHGAALLAMGVMAAFIRRQSTGQGARVEASLLNAGLDLQMESLGLWFAMDGPKQNLEREEHVATWLHDAPYGVYQIADCHVVISLGPNVSKIAEVLQANALLELGNEARSANRDAFANALAAHLRTMTWDELDQTLQSHGLWYERVAADFDEVHADPQVEASGGLETIDIDGRSTTLARHPVRYDGETRGFRFFAAKPGAHSFEVLRDAGFDDARIQGLISSGVIANGTQS